VLEPSFTTYRCVSSDWKFTTSPVTKKNLQQPKAVFGSPNHNDGSIYTFLESNKMRYVRDNANYSPQAVTQHGKTNT
jgi:hypothetical protein